MVGAAHRQQRVVLRQAVVELGVRRVVAELGVLVHLAQRVDAEAVDAAVEPEAQHGEHRLAHRRVAPVEVGLLAQVGVRVVLAALGVEGPGGTAEHAQPVVGRAAVRRRVAPEVVVARLGEPRVLVGGVVGHEVEQHAQPAVVRGRHQRVEVGERAEARVDRRVVGDVVAEVLHRRVVDRRQPDGVDAEPHEVVEPLRDPPQVADAVAVRVRERARIDVVDDAPLPPAHGPRVRGPRIHRRWTSA